MKNLTIEQTNQLITYFEDKLQDYLEVRKFLDVTATREEIEKIINAESEVK